MFILMREEIYEELYLAIKELPKRNQKVFALHVLGKNDNEIAESLSLAIHVVMDYKKEAIYFLKKKLGDRYDWFGWMKNCNAKNLTDLNLF